MRPITLRRYPAGNYVDGVWQEGGAPTDTTIRASVQPLAGSELRLLPEGDRGKIAWKLFTNVELTMGNDEGTRADQFIIDGIIFQMSQPDNWMSFGHSEVIVTEATK